MTARASRPTPRRSVLNIAPYVPGRSKATGGSKLHKLSERESQPNRLVDKDAHDIYRLLVAIETRELERQRQMLGPLRQNPQIEQRTLEELLAEVLRCAVLLGARNLHRLVAEAQHKLNIPKVAE